MRRIGDPDTGDGQGNCNLTRKAAAEALVDWIATDPTGSGDPDFLVIGDMNSYTFEDPITTFTDAGYRNLVREFERPGRLLVHLRRRSPATSITRSRRRHSPPRRPGRTTGTSTPTSRSCSTTTSSSRRRTRSTRSTTPAVPGVGPRSGDHRARALLAVRLLPAEDAEPAGRQRRQGGRRARARSSAWAATQGARHLRARVSRASAAHTCGGRHGAIDATERERPRPGRA